MSSQIIAIKNDPSIEPASENASLTELAYQHIKRKIQICEFMPGQEIYEKQLNSDLGYGRTPIREALLALKRENLIEIFPRKGMRIKSISREEITELYQIRKLLEPAVVQEYKAIYPKASLLDFEKKFKAEEENTDDSLESDISFYSLDISFHSYLINITQNHTLMNMYHDLMEKQFRQAIYGAKTKISQRSNNHQQHHQIIEAILNEDDAKIRESIIVHCNHALITLLKAFDH